MELMAAAKGADMPPDIRLLYIRNANSLARTCQQNENALAKRLAADPPPPELVAAPVAEPAPEPAEDISEAEVEAMIQRTHAQIIAYRKSIPEPPERQINGAILTAAYKAPRPAAPA
jgi:hypothetical protein